MRLLSNAYFAATLCFSAAVLLSPVAHSFSTHPAPPKIQPDHRQRLEPAADVPMDLQNAKVVVTDDFYGKKLIQGEVPVYRINHLLQRLQAGTIPVGTEIKVDRINQKNGRIFYGYFVDETVGGQTIQSLRWVDGLNLKFVWN